MKRRNQCRGGNERILQENSCLLFEYFRWTGIPIYGASWIIHSRLHSNTHRQDSHPYTHKYTQTHTHTLTQTHTRTHASFSCKVMGRKENFTLGHTNFFHVFFPSPFEFLRNFRNFFTRVEEVFLVSSLGVLGIRSEKEKTADVYPAYTIFIFLGLSLKTYSWKYPFLQSDFTRGVTYSFEGRTGFKIFWDH